MDAAQWPQGIGVVKSVEAPRQVNHEKKPRPQKEQALNCPRCNSTNTKFCYYNNYSLTQPRYFCKTCRRYWTEGGSLRNVPVGGGSRKNKRSSSSSSSPSISTNPSKKPIPDLTIQNPKINGPQDLNLAYQPNNPSSLNISSHHHIPNMEFLKTNGVSSSRGIINSFVPNIMPPLSDCGQIYSSGLNLHDYKPTLNFSLDGFVENGFNGNNNLQGGVRETNAKLFFPFEDLKQVSSTDDQHHQFEEENREQGDHQANGYWSGMLGGGSW